MGIRSNELIKKAANFDDIGKLLEIVKSNSQYQTKRNLYSLLKKVTVIR